MKILELGGRVKGVYPPKRRASPNFGSFFSDFSTFLVQFYHCVFYFLFKFLAFFALFTWLGPLTKWKWYSFLFVLQNPHRSHRIKIPYFCIKTSVYPWEKLVIFQFGAIYLLVKQTKSLFWKWVKQRKILGL